MTGMECCIKKESVSGMSVHNARRRVSFMPVCGIFVPLGRM